MTDCSQTRTRLCLVLPALGIGGAEKQVCEYLKYRPESLEVTVIYFSRAYDETPSSMLDAFKSSGATVIPYEMEKASLKKLLGLVALIRRLNPRVVHTVLDGSSGTWGRLAAWLAGVPILIHSDRSLAPPVTLVQRTLRPWLDRITTRFLPNADAVADWLKERGVDGKRIRVVPNGVDTERLSPSLTTGFREEWGIPPQAVVAGFLGRFSRVKRLDLLLDAVLALPEAERPDWVVLGGDGPEMEYVRARIESDLWLRRRCLLPGLTSDVAKFMASIDYLILCSDREGLPNVILEAWSMERPVIATRVSEVPRLVGDCGILVDPGDAAGLAHAISRLNRMTAEERRALGRAARQRVVAGWDIRNAAGRFWAAQLEVLQLGAGILHNQ